MTCDEAFEALTAPEPVSVAALAVHLLGCPRCRDLQDVLSPLRSAAAPQSLQAPGAPPHSHSQNLPESSLRIAQDAASRLSRTVHPQVQTADLSQRSYWPYLGAFLAGVAASVALATALPSTPSTALGETATACTWQSRALDGATAHEVALACVGCHPGSSR